MKKYALDIFQCQYMKHSINVSQWKKYIIVKINGNLCVNINIKVYVSLYEWDHNTNLLVRNYEIYLISI